MDFISQAIRGKIVEYDPEQDYEKAQELRTKLPTAMPIRIDAIYSYKDRWEVIGEFVPKLEGTTVHKGFLCVPGKSKCGNLGGEEIANVVETRWEGEYRLSVKFDRSGKGGYLYHTNVKDETFFGLVRDKVKGLWEKPDILDLEYPLYSYAFENRGVIEFNLFPKGKLAFEKLGTELVVKLVNIVVSKKPKPLTDFEKFVSTNTVRVLYVKGRAKLDISQFGSSVYWDGLWYATSPPGYTLYIDETKTKDVIDILTKQGFGVENQGVYT